MFYRVFDPIKHVLRVFWTASKTFLEKRVSREFITIMLLWTLKISIREKHRKSRAVSLYLIKHRILIRMRFIDIKSLHVMYYLPFDRLMGLWIINEFLNNHYLPLGRFIWIQHDQLPVCLLAHVVERCTGIAKVVGSNPGPIQLLVQ